MLKTTISNGRHGPRRASALECDGRDVSRPHILAGVALTLGLLGLLAGRAYAAGGSLPLSASPFNAVDEDDPPVEVVIVLDQAGTLVRKGAWDELKKAAKQFVDRVEGWVDRAGLVTFQIRGAERYPLSSDFEGPIKAAIDEMSPVGDRNAQEGLRLAYEQLNGPGATEGVAKVIVFFTDGQPNVFRGHVFGADRLIAAYPNPVNGQLRGYFNDPETIATDVVALASGCSGVRSCDGWTDSKIRQEARARATSWADRIREDDIYLYTVALGDPTDSPIQGPDLDWLRSLANQDGVVDPSKRYGRSYFAPSPAQLDDVFKRVADDLRMQIALDAQERVPSSPLAAEAGS